MARDSRGWIWIALALVLLAGGTQAQARGGKGRSAFAQKQGPKGNQKAAAPVGPRPKAPAKKPTKSEPVPPMQEADRVTAEADHLSAAEEERTRLLMDHFRVCDLDGNGWLSLREGEIILSLDRAEYRRADKNQDGRLDPDEFLAQQVVLLARLGALPASPLPDHPLAPGAGPDPSVERPPGPRPPDEAADEGRGGSQRGMGDPRTPETFSELGSMRVKPGDILKRYDADKSKGIDALEIERLFADLDLELSPDLVIAQMDPDDSGQLEAKELIAVAWMASKHLPERPLEPGAEAPVDPDSLDSPDPFELDPAGEAPRLTHFARLDASQDGFIDEGDLRTLQSPARLDLRLRAILSAMDQDGDGRLSGEEFRAAMLDAPR